MSHTLRHPLIELPRNGTLRIADGRGHVIAVFEGQVWLTQDGDERDVFLEAGDSFSFDRPGVTLVQALRDARLLVSAPAALERRLDSQALHSRARAMRDAAVAAWIARGVAAVESLALRAAQRFAQRLSAGLTAWAHRPLRAH
jgi:hypothetical protein